jgi:hypothetical protein
LPTSGSGRIDGSQQIAIEEANNGLAMFTCRCASVRACFS